MELNELVDYERNEADREQLRDRIEKLESYKDYAISRNDVETYDDINSVLDEYRSMYRNGDNIYMEESCGGKKR